MSLKRTLSVAALPLLLLAALLLRLQSWYPFLVADEETILTMVWGLHLDPLPPGMPPPLPGYPPLFIYLNYLLSLLYREAGLFLGLFPSRTAFFFSPLAKTFTLKAGEVLVALLGTLQVAVVWKSGKEFFNREVAWFAAILMALHPHLVLNGHIFKSDVLLALLFSLLLYFSLSFLETLQTKAFLIACILSGITVACKYNGAVEALLIPLLLLMARRRLPSGQALRLLFLAPLFGLLGFLAGAPNWIAHPVASFQAAWKYALFHFQEFSFYDKPSTTYFRYIVDLWETLGPLFVALFAAGVLFTLLGRKKKEMVVLASLLLYFLVQGRSVFYGNRIILPLYGAVALIIAKGAFLDILPLIRRVFWRRAFSLLIFGSLLLFSLKAVTTSLPLFHLWQTTTTLDEALAFRRVHIPPSFPLGRENFTPGERGDLGTWDIIALPHRLFHGSDALPFLSTGILADYLKNRSHNARLRGELLSRLQEYRPFHRVTKPSFSPWDGDILFWYRPHPKLLSHPPGREALPLPRLYHPSAGTTLFYPLQPYERDPGFFPLEGAFFGRWLQASVPLDGLEIILFCPEGETTVKLRLNGEDRSLSLRNGSGQALFPSPKPLPLRLSPVYRLEATLPERHPPVFLLLRPKGLEESRKPIKLSRPLLEDPPRLFSGDPPPPWAIELYRRSGIDLSLLSLTQEETLWENRAASLQPFLSGWSLLPGGTFRWEMETETILPNQPEAPPPPLELRVLREGRVSVVAIPWKRVEENRYSALFSNPEEYLLFRTFTGETRKSNLLLKRLTLRPDYRLSLLEQAP